ncbi:MAG: alpha/beta hydrolase [Thermoleophilaceae bacterium]|nr:alpha/beta hydrolase [Thermoleophilaceae bacterium]
MRTKISIFATAVLACASLAATATAKVQVSFERIPGYKSPGTPAKYNKVGILKVGSRKARNVIVLNPGTSASASYFVPLAKDVVSRAKGWQVWSVERRENLLEDHSVFNRAKAGKATEKQVFDYYLGWVTDPSIANHFEFLTGDLSYARQWGMNTEIEDLRRVVKHAERRGGKVVVGGHSLGGSITTAYATWDFKGKPGAKGLSGLVFIDGGSSPAPITPGEATERLDALNASSTPWLTFGGIPAPFAGLFNTAGALGALQYPDRPSLAYPWPGLPANLKPPVAPTNLGQYGYALDTETSPAGLVAAQAHLGRLAPSGDPRGWERAGELTPIRRYATMFSGLGLRSLDGTAWYHPQRLTIDSGAVAAGNANPAQQVLDVHATHGDDLSRKLKIYAFGASLGGTRVLDAARALASQSGIPKRNLKLVDRHTTYSHNDPNSASPKNDFVKYLIPFLKRVGR